MAEAGRETPRVPKPGEVLAGKYRVLSILGEGGMGIVFAAEHLRLRHRVAIKFLNPTLRHVSQLVERFDREARAAATLRSRHVVRVTDVEHTPDGVPFMVMELLDGADLESERGRRIRLPYAEVVDYVLQACGALAEAHEAGIVHRDLKPGNLFLTTEESTARVVVKVLDFGISKFLHGDDTKLTSDGAVMGTALYMSPEQVRSEKTIDARADIWSLGVILYELIAGEAPWVGAATRVAAAIVAEEAPPIGTRCELPPMLARTIHAMLAKKPTARPQTIRDVATALAPFAPPGSVGAEVAEQLARRSQRDVSAVPSAPGSTRSLRSLVTPDRVQLIVSAGANEQRSTMAATSSTMIEVARPVSVRPRLALLGAVAGALVVAVAALVFVLLRARLSPAAASAEAAAAGPSGSTIVASPAPAAASVSAEPPRPSPAALSGATAAATVRKPLVPAKPTTTSHAAKSATAAHPPPPPPSPRHTANGSPAEPPPLFLK